MDYSEAPIRFVGQNHEWIPATAGTIEDFYFLRLVTVPGPALDICFDLREGLAVRQLILFGVYLFDDSPFEFSLNHSSPLQLE